MSIAFRQLIARGYWAPAGEDGAASGGGSADADALARGDIVSPLDEAGKENKGDKLDPEDEKKDEPKDDEETEEEKAERLKAEEEAERKARIRIPKARFDEAQAKARAREQALQEEIAKLKNGQQASAATKAVKEMRTEIDELQDKYEDLILDGKKEEARKVRRQVEALRDELTDYQTSVKSVAARDAAVEELTYNAQLAGLEVKYPALNPENEDFDEEKTDEVADLLKVFAKSGMKRGDALAKAVRYVMGAPAAKTAEKVDLKALAERATAARKKAAEADKKQPPDGKNVGLDSDKAGGKGQGDIDVMRLTQDKFKKLDDDTLARLRGDFVE